MESDFSRVIPVTGTIGSGKSTFCGLLEKAGAQVVYADKLAHIALANLQREIIAVFGSDILTDNFVDRSKLGMIVFNDASKRKQLEAIVHPEVKRLAQIEFNNFLNSKDKPEDFIFYEVPLFFETGMNTQGFGPAVLITVNSDDEAVKRIIARGKESAEQARKRIAAQMPVGQKIALADIVIDNSGTKEELEREVVQLIKQLELSGYK